MRRVIVESPYAGDVDLHLAYLRDCLRDCYQRGEAPIASHAIGPLVLDDTIPEQRRQGVDAGLAWHGVADAVVVYLDLGASPGVRLAIEHAHRVGVRVEYRSLAAWRKEAA